MLADAGRWDRSRQCSPRCHWQQYGTFEHSIYGLWLLVAAGEKYCDAAKQQRVRFWVEDGLFRECREGGHPAFNWDGWEAWEILACLKGIAGFLSNDPMAQRRAWRGE
ncbi:MAG: hypothetical protein ACRETD_05290 [Steroidobacteraceae bacterium]